MQRPQRWQTAEDTQGPPRAQDVVTPQNPELCRGREESELCICTELECCKEFARFEDWKGGFPTMVLNCSWILTRICSASEVCIHAVKGSRKGCSGSGLRFTLQVFLHHSQEDPEMGCCEVMLRCQAHKALLLCKKMSQLH